MTSTSVKTSRAVHLLPRIRRSGRTETKQFFMREAKERRYLKGYEAYDSRQMAKMAHLERMEDGSFVLFDYKNRDALFGNAAAFSISQDEI